MRRSCCTALHGHGGVEEAVVSELLVAFNLESAVGIDYVGLFPCEPHESCFIFVDLAAGLGVVFDLLDVPE